MESGPTSRNLDNFHNPRPRSFKDFAKSLFVEDTEFRNRRFQLKRLRPKGYAVATLLLIAGLLSNLSFFAASPFFLALATAMVTVAAATAVYKIKDWKATKEYKTFVADKRIVDYWSDRWSLVILTNKEPNRDIADYFIQGKEAFKSDRAYIKSLSVWPAYFPGSKESNAWYAGFKAGEVESRKDKKILKRRAAANM